MNAQLLIDAIVHQTAVLIAQLATASGGRASLAHVADQVFLDVAREIETQGVSRKIAADMFGLALRTYQTRTQRLATTAAHRGRTLWEGILAYLEEQGSASRKQVFDQFADDHPNNIGAVLNDLVQSGFVEKVASPRGTTFTIAVPAAPHSRQATGPGVQAMVWVAVYRGTTSRSDLVNRLGLSSLAVSDAVDALRAQGRVADEGGRLTALPVVVPIGAEHGWEAAVFDHYQAMVTAITQKLCPVPRSASDDVLGGTTTTFEIHQHHPLRAEVRGLLRRVRTEVDDLRRRVSEHNREHPDPSSPMEKVSFYFGQSTTEAERT